MSRKPELQTPPPRLPPDRAELVLAELERVLSSSLFRASRRCQTLLRRITEQTVAGKLDSLKERALGVDVFGRHADYDTSQDPVVRASAAEIRKKLAQYYQESGHQSTVHIELPAGSYLAEFHFPVEAPAPIAPVVLPSETRPARPAKPHRRNLVALGVIAAVGILAVAVGLLTPSWSPSHLDELWGPVLKTQGPVLVCVGLQAAYNLRSAQAQDEVQGILNPAAPGMRRPIREEDLILLRNRYVALDDALCLVRLCSLLDQRGKRYRIRAERSTSFEDLRDTPAVLIGAFDNPWTLRAGNQLRFTFHKDSEQDTGMVYDREHPDNTSWKLVKYWPTWDVPEDYAIVTRMVDNTTDHPVIIAAGLTQYGTLGAGEFLSNPGYFEDAAKRLRSGWQKRNLQIVLSVPVVNHISGRPQVLETHVW